MIRFGEINDAKTKEQPEVFRNSKDELSESDQELDEFWKDTLEKESLNDEADKYDKLLSEVFNRDEDDIPIDFELNDEIYEVLDKISTPDWADMVTDEKLSLLQEFVDAVSKSLGIKDTPEVIISDCQDSYGVYDAENKAILLNETYLNDPVEAVDTTAHELRHEYQHMRAEKLETWEDELFKFNNEHYIPAVPLPGGGWLFMTDYMNQYVEADARAFANVFRGAME